MSLRNSADRYGTVSQTLHWLMAVLVLVAWTLGTFNDMLPKGPARATGLFVHVALGVAILALLMVRLPWRLIDAAPRPTTLSLWARRTALLVHLGLSVLTIAVVVAGIVLQFARGNPLPLFGIAEIASPWPANRAFARSVKEIHEVLANALIVAAALHGAAALLHHWILRDRTLVRMLPYTRR